MTAATWIQTFLQDLRYGTRELVRNRGVAGTALLSLALGIMATTAMYSVIHGVILDPFPYRDIDKFGIRLAVGAGFGHILGLVLMRGVRLIVIGLVVGAVATLLLLRRFGLELGVTDPYHAASISGAGIILIAAALAACLVLAVRAARTNPVKALRLE
jgi:hypothetical protein